MFSRSDSPESSTTRPSHSARLPVEILEMIIVHLIYNTRSLLACSLTCYSLYIVTVPHPHHTLITQTYRRYPDRKLKLPKPLWDVYNLGLPPLVKKFHICGAERSDCRVFSPKLFSWCTLRHFTALANVQELGIDHLDIPSFIPRINRYFGHSLPTVHSLALGEPQGSRRQIIYFIGLFKHLEDLKLIYDKVDSQDEPADDLTLVPAFLPPLRGRLTVTCFTRVGILKDMIDLLGGIRFRYMSLFNVVGMRLLLDACAETLETLQLHPTDPRGKELSPSGLQVLTGNFTGVSSIRDFDLSRNKALRTLEVTGRGIVCALFQAGSLEATTGPLAHALSTIASSAFTEVTIFYRDYDFLGVVDQQFKVFRAMRKIRGFQLVLCADTWDGVGNYTMGVLKRGVAVDEAKRGLGGNFPEPLVIHSPRGSHPQKTEFFAPSNKPWIPL